VGSVGQPFQGRRTIQLSGSESADQSESNARTMCIRNDPNSHYAVLKYPTTNMVRVFFTIWSKSPNAALQRKICAWPRSTHRATSGCTRRNTVGMGNFVPSRGSGLFDPVFTYVEETGTDASLVVRRGRKAHRTGQGHVGTRPFGRQTELHLTCMCSSTDSANRSRIRHHTLPERYVEILSPASLR